MKYRKMGNTGVNVSEISLGSWLTYGNSVDTGSSEDIIDTAYNSGINFFDTANVYALGEAEKVVGKALKKYNRDSFVLATKVYFPMGDGVNDKGLSRKHITEQLHHSLKRLQMDYVDVLYCHRYDEETPLYETLRAIDDLIRQGKVLYAGISAWTPDQIEAAIKIADEKLLDRIIIHQPCYNMLQRAIEKEIIPTCKKYNIMQAVYCPLAQGFLTGKYLNGIPDDSRAANVKTNGFISDYTNDEIYEKTKRIKEIADGLGVPMSQLALAWILREKNIASAIIGASKPSQVKENVKASGYEIPADAMSELEKVI